MPPLASFPLFPCTYTRPHRNTEALEMSMASYICNQMRTTQELHTMRWMECRCDIWLVLFVSLACLLNLYFIWKGASTWSKLQGSVSGTVSRFWRISYAHHWN